VKLARRTFLHLAAGAAALPAISRTGWAQTYPTRPIRLVVPFPPGGAFDALARPWADRIKPLLGTVIIENIGGGGASLGAAAVARARPDGYTLLFGGSLPYINEALVKSHPLYDPDKDLDPVVRVAVGNLAIAIHPSVPSQNLKELVTYAKANPGKLSYGHSGIGSLNHLTGELFKSLAGIPDVVQVSYRGAGPLISDMIGGQMPIGVVAITGQTLGFHRAGSLRILASTSPEPLMAAPELPTFAQAGFPGMTNQGSYGLLAPAGTPKPITEQIAQSTHLLLTKDDYQQMLVETGFEATPDSNAEEFRQTLMADVAHWRPVVTVLDLRTD
jgi:tripartite-type tricarboxylate transporter receptor subunit TctC